MMKDNRFTMEDGNILDNGMRIDSILGALNALNAKANPEPEEVRFSFGMPRRVVDLLNILDVQDEETLLFQSDHTPPEITMVKRGGYEWIEIAIPDVDGSRDIPYLYADADEAYIRDLPFGFRAGFEAARKVNPAGQEDVDENNK